MYRDIVGVGTSWDHLLASGSTGCSTAAAWHAVEYMYPLYHVYGPCTVPPLRRVYVLCTTWVLGALQVLRGCGLPPHEGPDMGSRGLRTGGWHDLTPNQRTSCG